MPIANQPPSDPSTDEPSGLIPGTLEGKPIGWEPDEPAHGPKKAPAKKPAPKADSKTDKAPEKAPEKAAEPAKKVAAKK